MTKELFNLDKLNILLWDIETLPYISMHWGMWKQNINPGQIIKDVSIICISYKWLGEEETHTLSIGDNPALFAEDPYAGAGAVVDKFLDVLDVADFCIAHNGDKFDYRILKATAVMNDLRTFRVRKVDTLKMAKSAGMFPEGNKLDSLAKVLGIEQKYKTNFGMWSDIALKSSTEALDKMERYCEQDVRVLEQVFLRLWPHAEVGLPNISTMFGGTIDDIECDKCGSDNVVKNGTYMKNVLRYQRFRCQSCGASFVGRRAIKLEV